MSNVQSASMLHVGWPAKFRETKFREMFSEIFISHFAKFSNDFREISRNEIYENFAKVIWQNCTETNVVSFLLLNSYRNLNFNSIFHYFVNKLCCEDKFFRDSHFKGTVSQDFLLWSRPLTPPYLSRGLLFCPRPRTEASASQLRQGAPTSYI